MELKWMRQYRDIVEQLIKFANFYSSIYKKEAYLGTQVLISYSQIQVLEYLLENEELHQNMSMIATRLGITPSAFSKLVNKLVQKGLLEKFYQEGNHKEIIIRVTQLGRQQYSDYSDYIYKTMFTNMFQEIDSIPPQYLHNIANMFKAFTIPLEEDKENVLPKLIPIEKKNGN
jgi:DNA-binding MarR family transcriptional regulator